MALPLMKNYINGEWVESNSTIFGDVWNPAKGEKIARVAYGTKEDVDHAVRAEVQRIAAEAQARGRASFTVSVRPSMTELFLSATAAVRLSSSMSTKPKPRGRPVSRSVTR